MKTEILLKDFYFKYEDKNGKSKRENVKRVFNNLTNYNYGK